MTGIGAACPTPILQGGIALAIGKMVLTGMTAAAIVWCFRWLHTHEVSLGTVELAQPGELPDEYVTRSQAYERFQMGKRMPRTLWNDLQKRESSRVRVVRTELAE